MYEPLAILSAFALVYSVVAGRVERTWISGPMVFIAVGFVIGPAGGGLLTMTTDAEMLKSLAELSLALVLFTDAAGADLGVLRRVERVPMRLLFVGLPLTIVLGFAVGKLLFWEFSLLEAALLATMLAPTDADLGKPVVVNEVVPDSVRQGLNVESGLNDGICVPILFLFLSLVEGESVGRGPWRQGLALFVKEVGVGLAAGVALTAAATALLWLSKRRKWISPTWIKIPVIALAFACFGSAQSLGGSGFIASFAGGLLFGGLMKRHRDELLGAAEGVGDTFALLTWVLFGAAVVGGAIGELNWRVVAYAALSLTVIRMAPVFCVLAGLKVSTEGKLFIGWFGPRGLASIVFIVIVLNAELPHGETLAALVVTTVMLSIVAHGATANPWAAAYGRRVGRRQNAGLLDG